MGVDHFRWFAEEARRAYDRVVSPQVQQKRHLVFKQPIGVVGAIAPWNFPLVLLARKVAPALAAGCPVVAKPASATPISAVELAKCVESAGLPPGVFQVVSGQAPQIGAELLENPICRKITFTGSTPVGKQLIKGGAEILTKLSLELGGNAPVLVFADTDFNTAIDGGLMAKFRNTGQSCAANRIYVQRSIYERFLETFVAKVKVMKAGNGLDETVDVGPLIDMHALENTLAYIEDARSKGARLLCGGRRWGNKGAFVEPTVLADVPADAACMKEEIFAPVASVCAFETEEEAIEKANMSEYGLSAYAFTSNLNRFIRLVESIEAGTLGINDGAPTTSNCPFGGFKQSGWGRELGIEGLDAFLETKHVSIGGMSFS
jgi:succinate-semialdehyde dehydrogenase/glutarate-semialdehyde dehydrogenase